MGEAQVKSLPSQQVMNNHVVIAGRIDAVREWESQDGQKGGFVSLVKLPAPDEYSSAQTVEVSSRKKLGRQGDEIKQLCSIGGFLKRGRSQDGKPWEICNMRLTALEA